MLVFPLMSNSVDDWIETVHRLFLSPRILNGTNQKPKSADSKNDEPQNRPGKHAHDAKRNAGDVTKKRPVFAIPFPHGFHPLVLQLIYFLLSDRNVKKHVIRMRSN